VSTVSIDFNTKVHTSRAGDLRLTRRSHSRPSAEDGMRDLLALNELRDYPQFVNDGRILTLWRRLKIDPCMVVLIF